MDSMHVYPIIRAKVLPEDVVFRQSRVWMAVGIVVTAIFPGLGIFFFLQRGAPRMLAWYFTVAGALALLFLLSRAARVFSAANWVLRLYGQRILIKVGRPLDAAQAFVVEFQRREIEWVRAHRRSVTMEQGGERVTSSNAWLELKPRDAGLAELEACIKIASVPREWHGWKWMTPIPVSLTRERVLRVEWHGKHILVSPSLKWVLALLGTDIPVLPQVNEQNDLTQPADTKKLEDQIVDLIEHGELLQAITVVRKCYGYSLAEAREFVDGFRANRALTGGSNATKSIDK